MAEVGSSALGFFRQRVRWSRWEYLFWAAWVAAYFLPATNHALLSQVLVWGLFAMSLDILLGYRGVPSLGHAAFFGIGAYTAGFLGKFGWHEPISGLLIPNFQLSASNGVQISDTWYQRLADNRDLTVTGYLFTGAPPMVSAQYRQAPGSQSAKGEVQGDQLDLQALREIGRAHV